nr:hypothetical protein BgiMline_024534 [Biomphalaria glabrata]
MKLLIVFLVLACVSIQISVLKPTGKPTGNHTGNHTSAKTCWRETCTEDFDCTSRASGIRSRHCFNGCCYYSISK